MLLPAGLVVFAAGLAVGLGAAAESPAPLRPAFRGDEVCIVHDGKCLGMSLDQSVTRGGGPPPGRSQGRSVQVVVTRFREDVRWLDSLADVDTIVYDRGGVPGLLPRPRSNLRVVPQVNSGREDECMIRHVLDNYDQLPDMTVFLQGWPFGHCAGAIPAVRTAIQANGHVQIGHGAEEGLMPITHAFHRYKLSDGRLGLAREIFETAEAARLRQHTAVNLSGLEEAVEHFNRTCLTVLGATSNDTTAADTGAAAASVARGAASACPDNMWVAEGAQWVVSRERLRRWPRELYEVAVGLGEGYLDKHRGLVLEALWPHIWGVEDWVPFNKTSKRSPELSAAWQLRAGSGYCELTASHEDEETRITRLQSCEERMSTCELQARLNPLSINMSSGPLALGQQLFLEQRHRFKITGGEGQPWSMIVELVPVHWGFPSKRKDIDVRRKKEGEEKSREQVMSERRRAAYEGLVEEGPGNVSEAMQHAATDAALMDEAREASARKRQRPSENGRAETDRRTRAALGEEEEAAHGVPAATAAARGVDVDETETCLAGAAGCTSPLAAEEASSAEKVPPPPPEPDDGDEPRNAQPAGEEAARPPADGQPREAQTEEAAQRGGDGGGAGPPRETKPARGTGLKWVIRDAPGGEDRGGDALFYFEAPPKEKGGPLRYLQCEGVMARLRPGPVPWQVVPAKDGFVHLYQPTSGVFVHFRRKDSGRLRCYTGRPDTSEATWFLRTLEREESAKEEGAKEA